MSLTEKKVRQQIAKALYVGKRTRASIPGLPVWDWEPAWLQDEYLAQADDLLPLFAGIRTAALEDAAAIADAIGLKRKSNACLEVVEAIRAVAGTP